MSSAHDLSTRVDQLRQSYAQVGGPTPDQWERLLAIPGDRPVTLVNFFAFRDAADYGDSSEPPATGRDAFNAYAAVSGPALDNVGGRFVHVGEFRGPLADHDEVPRFVGEYPSLDALLALHEDPAYRTAYRHRVAACTRQRVLISA